MFLVVNASDAAVKTAIASAPAASALSSPRRFGNEHRVADVRRVGERRQQLVRVGQRRGSPTAATNDVASISRRPARRGARCSAAWRPSGGASPRSGDRRAARPRRSGPGRPTRSQPRGGVIARSTAAIRISIRPSSSTASRCSSLPSGGRIATSAGGRVEVEKRFARVGERRVDGRGLAVGLGGVMACAGRLPDGRLGGRPFVVPCSSSCRASTSALLAVRRVPPARACGQPSISATRSPRATCCPGRTAISATVPGAPAATTCSIFIASSVTSGSPASTVSPASTWTREDRAGHRRDDLDRSAATAVGSGRPCRAVDVGRRRDPEADRSTGEVDVDDVTDADGFRRILPGSPPTATARSARRHPSRGGPSPAR